MDVIFVQVHNDETFNEQTQQLRSGGGRDMFLPRSSRTIVARQIHGFCSGSSVVWQANHERDRSIQDRSVSFIIGQNRDVDTCKVSTGIVARLLVVAIANHSTNTTTNHSTVAGTTANARLQAQTSTWQGCWTSPRDSSTGHGPMYDFPHSEQKVRSHATAVPGRVTH